MFVTHQRAIVIANGKYHAVKLEAHFWLDKNDSTGFARLLCQDDKTDYQRGNN